LQRLGQIHIDDIDFVSLYRPVFRTLAECQEFCQHVESLPPPSQPKIMLHQAGRMLWLADQIEGVAAGRPAFQILFYLVAGELVAKIVFNFRGEGESRKYVHRFFEEICSGDRSRLANGFFELEGRGRRYLSCEEVVDVLYDVRCDVVHEGRYYDFNMRRTGHPMRTHRVLAKRQPISSQSCSVPAWPVNLRTELSASELREIVLRGVVTATRKLLSTPRLDAPL